MSLEGSIMRFIAFLPLTWAVLSTAQTVTSPTSKPPAFSARSTVVLVPALVRTKTGELVFSLTAGDFAITDDAIEQRLRLRRTGDTK
jgi:hypothetical protein